MLPLNQAGGVCRKIISSPSGMGLRALYAYYSGTGQAGNTLFARIDGLDTVEGTLSALTDVVRNPRYSAADNSLVDCELYFCGAWHPFTASQSDPMWWGQQIYAAAVAGELGDVAAYDG